MDIRSSSGKSIIIGVVYRPPNREVPVFNEVLDDLLHTLRLNQKAIYIICDYIINLLNCDMHQSSGNFFRNYVFPLINTFYQQTSPSNCKFCHYY